MRTNLVIVLAFLAIPIRLSGQVRKSVKNKAKGVLEKSQAIEAEKIRRASSSTVRRFHEVLDELLAEFGYDVKLGQINDLKNVAIRKVEVSSALPKTYQDYTKLLVTERIKENSDIRVVNCIPCHSRTSRLIEGKLIITSPSTNMGELKTAADRLGIDTFMDIVLVYHSTHMVLAFEVFKVGTGELIWARTYNSETIKSRYQKLAIDYSQVAKSRPGEEYQPEYRLLFGLGGAGVPNIGGTEADSRMLAFQFRSTERFDNRRSEFGMLFSIFMNLGKMVNNYPAVEGTGETTAEEDRAAADLTNPAQPEAFQFALGLWAMYAYNFIGVVESYNQIRHGLHFGLGGLLATGYVAGSARLGWDIYFGPPFFCWIWWILCVLIPGHRGQYDAKNQRWSRR